MNTNQIVELITKEVLKKLYDINEDKGIPTKSVLITANYSKEYESLYKQVNKCFKVIFLNQLKDKITTEQVDYIIVPKLDNNTLSKVALGITDDIITSYISDAFMSNKKVIVLEEGISYRKYKGLANDSYYNMYRMYEEQLKQYGGCIVKQENLNAEGLENDNTLFDNKNIINKRIIVEADVKKLFELGNQTILISNKSIISPLALDYIRINDINITKK